MRLIVESWKMVESDDIINRYEKIIGKIWFRRKYLEEQQIEKIKVMTTEEVIGELVQGPFRPDRIVFGDKEGLDEWDNDYWYWYRRIPYT